MGMTVGETVEYKLGAGRICFIMLHHPAWRTYGTDVQSWTTALGFVQRGWEVHCIFEAPAGAPPTEPRLAGVRLHRLPPRKEELVLLSYPGLRRILAEIDADVYVHVGLRGYAALLGWPPSVSRRLVLYGASTFECDRRAYIKAWQRDPRHDWKRPLRLAFAMLNGTLVNSAVRRARVILALTREEQDLIRKAWGREAVTIAQGHPVPKDEPAKASEPIVLWVANLVYLKRPLLFAELAARCQDLPARFVMVGWPVERSVVNALMRRVAELPNLEYLGGKCPEEANDLMAQASLLVNTSEWEGLPNSFLQAWMRRTPTLTVSVDPDGMITRFGLGAVAGSVQGLESMVRELLQKPTVLAGMGRRARDYASREFDVDRVVDRMEELIRSRIDIGRQLAVELTEIGTCR